jgi:hypothetical protein
MIIRRAATWITVALAILVHLVAGLTRTGSQLCICSSGVTIEQQESGCCDPQPGTTDAAEQQGDCTDCHLIPLPDAWVAGICVPPSCPPAATLPESILVATIVWPSVAAHQPAHLRAFTPDPLRRLLRTVVLTC